ncbi:hypothetical protein FOCC_FOCC002244 [Frankliniella occidentalis]|nr:hypothetical protein FOCC_FOCC002244 [Frankliniella occidentalis]
MHPIGMCFRTHLRWIQNFPFSFLECTAILTFDPNHFLHVDPRQIFRHGQRTPADTYPNDPYEKFDFAPVGWGQLTLAGKRDQYEQGRWLRRRYGRFLGDEFHPDVAEVLSTDVDRTKMSAMLAMAGLWPPAPEQRWHPTLDWQPSPRVRALLQEHGKLLDWLSEQTGMKIADPDDVQSLFEINAMTREMQRIKGGPLLKRVLEHSAARAAGSLRPERRRMFVYAGHDSTVSNFLISLGAWDTQIPGYGVLLFLRNSTAVPPYALHIEGCGLSHFCPLTRLAELTRDVIPTSLKRACVAKDPNYTPLPPSGP